MALNLRTDFSFLFSSLNNSSGASGMSSFLSDYASIKNGSYGKLMKAYYAEGSKNDTVKSLARNSVNRTTENKRNVVSKQDAENLNKVKTTTDSLKESADALLKKGSKSVFAKKDITTKDENGVENTVEGYDTDAIYKAVNSFVTNYNSVINAVDNADNSAVTNRAAGMVNNTKSNENLLNKVGITVRTDGTLSLDKDTFMKADMSTVKTLFNGTGSYGYQTSAQASLVNYSAGNEAAKAATYTANGTYNSALNSGNIYNSFF